MEGYSTKKYGVAEGYSRWCDVAPPDFTIVCFDDAVCLLLHAPAPAHAGALAPAQTHTVAGGTEAA